MKSKRYLAAVLALPALGGTAAAATINGAQPVVVHSAGLAVEVPGDGGDTDGAETAETEPTIDDRVENDEAEVEEVSEEPADIAEVWEDGSVDADAAAAFWDAGYSYQQLLALADYWDLDQFEAKVKAGNLLLDGEDGVVEAALADVGDDPVTLPAPGDWNPTADDLDAFAAYWDAGYSYEQLVALAVFWDLTEFEAKVKAGNLVRDGEQERLDTVVSTIDVESGIPVGPSPEEAERYRAVDAFYAAGFSYDQAISLSEVWEIEVGDAKVKAGRFILGGEQAERVDAVLELAG